MPQISLYVDKKTLEKVSKAASLSKTSVSDWVAQKIKQSLKTSWPEGFFTLFGRLKDDTFKRPPQKSILVDTKRETF